MGPQTTPAINQQIFAYIIRIVIILRFVIQCPWPPKKCAHLCNQHQVKHTLVYLKKGFENCRHPPSLCITAPTLIVYRPNNHFCAHNPDGPWSFGFVQPDDHLSFQLYPKYAPNVFNVSEVTSFYTQMSMSGNAMWYSSTQFFTEKGFIVHNNNLQTAVQYGSQFMLAPDQLAVHPGPLGEHGCIRFKVPSAGLYDIHGTFFSPGVPPNPGGVATTSAHLSINNVELRSLWINRNSGILFLNQTYLNVGDYLQFEVGYGENKNFGADTTAVNIVITAYI